LLSASVNDQQMFGRIVDDLTSPAVALKRENRVVPPRRSHRYQIVPLAAHDTLFSTGVTDFVIKSEEHGIPQARHRVILVGIRDDLDDIGLNPLTTSTAIPVQRVLDGLPRLRSGLTIGDSAEAWLCSLKRVPISPWFNSVRSTAGPAVESAILDTVSTLVPPRRGRGAPFIEGDFEPQHRPDWYADGRLEGIAQHESRPHLESDLHRYLFVSSYGKALDRSPRLNDFPKRLLPAHASVTDALSFHGYFQDRFRVQLRDRAATTITSHIAKDGHAYIHHDPSQCRSLTLREAARIQTFPDNYFFAGARTRGYAQVGNAVPPLLALQIADSVRLALGAAGVRS